MPRVTPRWSPPKLIQRLEYNHTSPFKYAALSALYKTSSSPSQLFPFRSPILNYYHPPQTLSNPKLQLKALLRNLTFIQQCPTTRICPPRATAASQGTPPSPYPPSTQTTAHTVAIYRPSKVEQEAGFLARGVMVMA